MDEVRGTFCVVQDYFTVVIIKDNSLQNYRLFLPYLKHTISMHVSILTWKYNAGNLE